MSHSFDPVPNDPQLQLLLSHSDRKGRKIELMKDNDTGNIVVMKTCSISATDEPARILERVKELSQLENESIVRCMEASLNPPAGEGALASITIVLDYSHLGNLDKYVNNLSHSRRTNAAQALLEGIDFLEEYQVFGSIKPSNVLFQKVVPPPAGEVTEASAGGRPDVPAELVLPQLRLDPWMALVAPATLCDFSAPELASQPRARPDSFSDRFAAGLILACIYGDMTSAELHRVLDKQPAWRLDYERRSTLIRARLAARSVRQEVLEGILELLAQEPTSRPSALSLLERWWGGGRRSTTPVHGPEAAPTLEQLAQSFGALPPSPDSPCVSLCAALDHLSGSPEMMPMAPRQGAAWVSILKAPVTAASPYVMERLGTALARMGVHLTNRTVLGHAHVAEALLALLKVPLTPENTVAMREILHAVAILGLDSPYTQSAFAKGRIEEPLMALLASPIFGADPALAEQLGAALGSLAQCPLLRDAIGHPQVATALVGVLRGPLYPRYVDTVRQCCRAVGALCVVHIRNQTIFRQAGVVGALIGLLLVEAASQVPALSLDEELARCLGNCCTENRSAQNDLLREGAVRALFALTRKLIESMRIRGTTAEAKCIEWVFWCCNRLAEGNTAAQRAFLEASATELMGAALHIPAVVTSPGAAEEICRLVSCLCGCTALEGLVAAVGPQKELFEGLTALLRAAGAQTVASLGEQLCVALEAMLTHCGPAALPQLGLTPNLCTNLAAFAKAHGLKPPPGDGLTRCGVRVHQMAPPLAAGQTLAERVHELACLLAAAQGGKEALKEAGLGAFLGESPPA
ncbi:hypothetical protein PAPYR_653 [Paratrimastix pyriformis]|uniref:Protein kinase domain-containing protein n=1 Tax=Paratrimastix pyriformis TaxID=342808 RepID=A0ABQ8UUW5_9EUKA|nr:hypothetical protein PAPYR_653 [Paratrimastix pyriformis]